AAGLRGSCESWPLLCNPGCREVLTAAAFLGFRESVEQASGVGAGQRFQAVRLPLLDRVAGNRTERVQELDLALHLVMPLVFVGFTDVREHAELRDRAQLGFSGPPHVTREG